ncbi:hypothetical protein ACPTKP_30475, partial [Pseudomonas aeruginosa]|uniref:hypothetical protein n=1 Tax=Pseudomonas aeruginosa TaxID=287 RepID=UPI003CC6B7C0
GVGHALVHHIFEMIFTLVRLDESSVDSNSGAIFAFESRQVLQVLKIRGRVILYFHPGAHFL